MSYNIEKWLKDNNDKFVPPVCNFMMHKDDRLKVMYVGGPNIRKDFHLEEGEEFFYMHKGDMVLRILEQGNFKDILIKEGEVFQLPGKIPHSPQRFENTMGLVIERERIQTEFDCLRYYVGESTDVLYEEWFYCKDLGTEIGPVIKRYFASEAHKAGKPTPGSVNPSPPYEPDQTRVTERPFNLRNWITEHMKKIQSEGKKRLWDASYQSDISAIGEGEDLELKSGDDEIWLWQLIGESQVTIGNQISNLAAQDTTLIKRNTTYSHKRSSGSVCLYVAMPWSNKNRAFLHLKK